MTFSARFRPACGRPTCTLLVMTCLILPLAAAGAEAAPVRHIRQTAHARSASGRSRGSRATGARTFPRVLRAAAFRSRRADRTLVSDARGLKRCRAQHAKHPKRCDAARRAVQRAGTRLARAERQLAAIASGTGAAASTSRAAGPRQAPQLSVSGQTLHWTRVARIGTYVLVSRVPGQIAAYSVVRGRAFTPPPVPGVTVRYAVRTTTGGSAWSTEQSISYPSAPGTSDSQAAPSLGVSGQTLTWAAMTGVRTYILETNAPGQVSQYSVVSGTSTTPPAVPGATVHYTIRTAVDGSTWSPEVSISYPAATPIQPTPGTASRQSPLTGPMWVGVDAGAWPSSVAGDVAGAVGYVRLDSPGSIAGWTAAGLKVIDCRSGPYSEGGVSAINASQWAQEAVAWYDANPEAVAIEVLNEPGNSGFWGPNAGDQENATAYAHLLKVVHEAFVANGRSPVILASYDGGEGPTTWGEEVFRADPNVGSYIGGITMHSYGGTENRAASALGTRYHIEAAHAQHPDIPIYVTEVGWPTAVGQPPTGDSLQWTEAEQAANITGFIDWAKGTGYIADVTIFNYRDYGSNDWYGIESASGAHKLGYDALAAFPH